MRTVLITDILINRLRNFTLVHLLNGLRLHRLALNIALFIQDLLKRVILPPEYVIPMISISSAEDC